MHCYIILSEVYKGEENWADTLTHHLLDFYGLLTCTSRCPHSFETKRKVGQETLLKERISCHKFGMLAQLICVSHLIQQQHLYSSLGRFSIMWCPGRSSACMRLIPVASSHCCSTISTLILIDIYHEDASKVLALLLQWILVYFSGTPSVNQSINLSILNY